MLMNLRRIVPTSSASNGRPPRLLAAAGLLSLVFGCLAPLPLQAQPAEPTLPTNQRELLNSTLWTQSAHEYRYNTTQVYRQAKAALDAALRRRGTAALEQQGQSGLNRLPPAVVLDLDETVLDNSAFQGHLISRGVGFNEEDWARWLQLRQATAVPGALEFARAASRAGVKLFYVTNRACASPGTCPAKAATMDNLRALGFPRASDPSAFLLRNERPEWAASDKSSRREAVAQTHRIVMLLGDDLQDFMSTERAQALRAGRDAEAAAAYDRLLGVRWFVLPNPMYGSWERSFSGGLAGRYAALRVATLGSPPDDPGTPIGQPSATDLTLATWNLEWLMTPETFDELLPTCNRQRQPASDERAFPCTPGFPPIERRTPADLDALARVAERIQADVVALQEVDGPAAGALVFRQGWTLDCFVSRAHPQKVGFAIRSGLPYRCNPELAELDTDGSSRSAADITLFPGTPQAVRLLAVHLKSGCFTGSLASGGACPRLRQQVPVLEAWVDARAAAGERYVILGDFNRRLEIDAGFGAGNDEANPTSMFTALSDGNPAGAVLRRASSVLQAVPCSSQDNFPPTPIDNILVSENLAQSAIGFTATRLVFDDAEAASLNLSDHCPIRLALPGALR